MSSPKDTIAVPCRHLCVCHECAEVLRKTIQPSRQPSPPKCPICRQSEFIPFSRLKSEAYNLRYHIALQSLLQISLPQKYQRGQSRTSLIVRSAPLNEETSSPNETSIRIP